MRCTHEISQHKYNSYITLTYDEKHLQESRSLQHKDFQLFIKRMREQIARNYMKLEPTAILYDPENLTRVSLPESDEKHACHEKNITDILKALKRRPRIRFYMAGEYGEKYGRPHFHAILFGVDFGDKIYLQRTPSGEKIYRSPTLEKLWNKGFSSVGAATFNSAAYIARYIMSKRTGDKNRTDYDVLDLETGEIIKKRKEYNQMSRASGIGHDWLKKYHADIYNFGKVVTKTGKEMNPPRYYDKLYKKMDEAQLERIKAMRDLEAQQHKADQTPERLRVQEIVANANASKQARILKGET